MTGPVRSWLFAPGDVEARCRKAMQQPADQVIWDWEDGVAAERKDEARRWVLSEWSRLSEARHPWIRINGVNDERGPEDLAALAPLMARAGAQVVVPKIDAAAAERLESLVQDWQPGDWLLIVESAQGLWDLMHAPRRWLPRHRVRLAFGALDYQTDVHGDVGPLEDEILMARSHIVLASRVLGYSPPIDAVCPDIHDAAGLQRSALHARRVGFVGKMIIHPRQVPIANAAFSPSPQELAWAERVIAGIGDAGVAQIDGQMIDRPLIERARQILEQGREEFKEPEP